MSSEQGLAFGTLLRRARRAASLTQEEVAEHAGVSVRTISDLERGVNHTPHADTVTLLADALGLQNEDRAAFAAAAGKQRPPPGPRLPRGGTTSGVAPFVGRQRELALLERQLAGQGPPLLLLAGEPGIGKTRLLRVAAPRAIGHGLGVLEGGCQRLGGQEPYAPLLAALKGHLRRQTPRQQRAALRGCAWLVRLLPELVDTPIEPLPARTLPPGQERRLMFEAVVRFLTNVAEQGTGSGILLLLDDLQWAGPDALDLLTTLARSAGDISLRMIGAYRDTEVDPQDRLFVALADLAHAGLATRCLLAPLSSEESAQLLDGLLAPMGDERPVPRERVLQQTGGVPFFLVTYAQAVSGRHPDSGKEDTVPWDIGQSVRQRVAALSGVAQDVLGAAAVLGREVAPTLLAGAVIRPEDEILAAFDAACRARLLEERGTGTYQFAHDVIREVVESALGAARRTALHRRIAEALERQPGERAAELLAYHYGRGGVHDKAVLYLEQAGDRAMAQYAHGTAERFYAEAGDGWEQLGQPVEAARLQVKAGAALREMGRFKAAQVALEGAVEAFRASGDYAHLIKIVAEIGRHFEYQGRPAEGLRWLEPQIAVLEAARTADIPGHVMAPLYQTLAILYLSLGRWAEAMRMTARSVEIMREVGAGSALATALYRRAHTLLGVVGCIEDMRQVATEAMGMAEVARDLNALHWALYYLAYTHLIKGEWGAYSALADRALAVDEQRGNPGPLTELLSVRSRAAFFMGDWAGARREAERAQAYVEQLEDPYAATLALLPLARLSLAEGQWELAARRGAEALTLAQRSGRIFEQREAYAVLAELDLRAGRAREAYTRLAPVQDAFGVEERGVTPLLVLLAWARLELGANEPAQRTIAEALCRLRKDDDRLGLVDALRVQAMVRAKYKRCAEAVANLEEGLALAGAMPYPYGEARLLHVYGQLYAQNWELALARERLRAALAIFRQLNARKDLEQTEQLLAKVG